MKPWIDIDTRFNDTGFSTQNIFPRDPQCGTHIIDPSTIMYQGLGAGDYDKLQQGWNEIRAQITMAMSKYNRRRGN